MRRRNEFDDLLSRNLKGSSDQRKIFFLTMFKKGKMDLVETLKAAIATLGIVEFSKLSGIRQPNVNNFVNGKRRLKTESLDAFLKPFGLRTKLTVEDTESR